MTKVSIVIVNYNVRQFLIQCVESILKSKFDLDLIEIIIVDNASIDGSVEYFSTNYPNVKIISNKENVGFSKANNQGIKIAKGEFVLILNPDTLIQEDTIYTCVQFIYENESCGVLGVKMIDGSGKYLPESKRGEPTLWNSFTKFTGLTSLFSKSRLFSGYYLGHLDENQIQNVEVLCGAFMFFRKDVLMQANGFDEDYFMYGEDIDLSRKIRMNGWEVKYLPTTKIIHFKGESTKKTSYNYIKNFYTAMKIYVGKNYNGLHGFFLKQLLNVIIYTLALLSYLKNIVKNNIRLLFDAALIFGGTQVLKQWWGTYHFHNSDYFDNIPSYYNNLGITFIYTFFLWFFGQYENFWRVKRLIFAVAISFIISLIIYALLPLSLRSSRIIIVISALLGLAIPLLSKYLFGKINQYLGINKEGGNYLIVASKENSIVISEIISSVDKSSNIIGTIYPKIKEENLDGFYLNSINNLSAVVKTMRANKIILCTEDLNNQTILDLMILPESEVNYLITSVNNKILLVSNDKNRSGSIYATQSTYNLSQNIYLRVKRMFDILLSIFFILLLPLFVFNSNYRNYIFTNLIPVLLNRKTWVGYISNTKAEMIEKNIPHIKTSVFNNSILINNFKYFPLIIDNASADVYYAKNYSPLLDMDVLNKKLF